MNLDEKIKQHIPQDELLAQLAEECAELSQAALKLRRALTGINPTSVTVDRGKKESGGGGSGCLQRTGAAVGCGGQRRDIRHYPEEESKMGETAGGMIV